ncbi:Heterokaryon incompatibility [Akanthomyces lecanii RCEF 1005]|uniref:Heterokaryon incompatibility n=1 Tax=Akanthomyces lecanii RCEF 1005 TaxID=1081108 RepID=A0A162JHY3_CORDF|nr:Heterokaryon incompatibility [Akanthomyces lecanii RCEF 1005]
MTLCDICSSIAFENLPPFPTNEYQLTLSGLQHVHMLVVKRGTSKEAIAALSRVRHHASLASLRTAADNGCKLCALILAQSDALLTELETLQNGQRSEGHLPTFDMWLSQREEGGQGFCVWSNSVDHAGGARIVPVAAFAFVVGDDDYPSTSIRGRPVTRNFNADAVRRFVNWNTEYEQDEQRDQDAGSLPQCLIDVQSSNTEDSVKIVELDAHTRHRYAVLSYASAPEVVHYRGQTRIQAHDEVSIYLWIDSLCVPDGSWARYSEQAATIYENAYLALSATGANNISDGLLFQRPTSALLRIPYGADEDGPRTVSVAALPLKKEIVREEYIEMRKQPISQDVWQFQDRVLSRRTLHFATDQMYYECLHHFASEDGLLQRLRYHTPVERLPEGTEHFRRRCLDEDPHSRWCALVWDYGQCSSNGRADKLKALSNVARAFQRLENDVYIAGHWRKSLPESLFWRSLSCKPSSERNAPSWSWASVDGVPAMGLGYSRAREYPAKIIDVRVTLADSRNAFGSVMTAEIELEAPLVPLKLLDKPEADDSGHMFVVAEDSDDRGFYAGFDTIDRNYAQSAGAVRGMQFFALILVLTHAEGRPAGACGTASSIGALIVTPADDSGDRMMRLGSFSAAEPRLPYARLGLHKTTILV